MKSRIPASFLIALLLAPPLIGEEASSRVATPGAPIDYKPLAFQPKSWEAKGLDTQMLPWTGNEVVFLTTPGTYDGARMARWLDRLDRGWALYAGLTGRRPNPNKLVAGRPVIAAVPSAELTCGVGCGFVGATGIELAKFYQEDWTMLEKQPEAMPHYAFYEMGRNFYTFGDRHSCFITGYAVFMRYVCMDTLGCADPDQGTRRVIEEAERGCTASPLGFLDLFTNQGSLSEKQPRLKDSTGGWIQPSDQPGTYASPMLRLRRENGGNDWVRRFFRALAECPEAKPNNREAALTQCWHWMLCASLAAGKDLSPIFVGQWRLPVADSTGAALAKVDWKDPKLTIPVLLQSVHSEWKRPPAAPDR